MCDAPSRAAAAARWAGQPFFRLPSLPLSAAAASLTPLPSCPLTPSPPPRPPSSARQVMREAGVPASDALHLEVRLNGRFHGLYALITELDATWLQARARARPRDAGRRRRVWGGRRRAPPNFAL